MKYKTFVFAVIIVLCLTCAPVYGEESLIMGDGQVELTVPDGWDSCYYYENNGFIADDEVLKSGDYWNLMEYKGQNAALYTPSTSGNISKMFKIAGETVAIWKSTQQKWKALAYPLL